MNPKNMAAWLTEDPDVMREAYCDACGGWDKEQQGSGHKTGCPVGEPGTSIKPEIQVAAKSELWVCSGRFPIDGIAKVYGEIKEFDGVIVSYHGTTSIYVVVMFDDFKSAEEFQHINFQFNGPLDPADMRTPEEYNEFIGRFKSGAIEQTFVRQFDLS